MGCGHHRRIAGKPKVDFRINRNAGPTNMNGQLKARLKGIQEVLMAHHRATSRLPNAAKGDEREVLTREFLEKVFPLPYRFGSGAITDSTGSISGQLDIIIEWPFLASFPAPLGTNRLYLAESVAYIISVKSNLSSQWKQVEKEVAQLRPLRRHWAGTIFSPEANVGGINYVGPSESRIPLVAVGFEGSGNIAQLKSKLKDTASGRRPDAALVIKSGAYVSELLGSSGIAEEGLFAFCKDGSHFVRNVLSAFPDLTKY